MKERLLHIDILRAIAIVDIIVIHTLSFNLTSSLNNFIWNYLHTTEVVAFVFCSGYVVVNRALEHSTFRHWIEWIIKRVKRLIIPFYTYLAIHYALMLIAPQFFSGLGLRFDVEYFIKTAMLTGGLAISWVPLLFIQMTMIFPFLLIIYKKAFLHIVYLVTVLLFLIWLTFFPFPKEYYRLVMWLPWSLVLYISIYFYHLEKERGIAIGKYILGALLSITIFIILFFCWSFIPKSYTLTTHKYPPDLYYFSYAFFGTFLVLIISGAKTFLIPWIKKLIDLLSQESYALFFIHYILLDVLIQINKNFSLGLNVWMQIILVLIGSIGIAYILKRMRLKNVMLKV